MIKALSDAYRKRTGDYGRLPRVPMAPEDKFKLKVWLLSAAAFLLVLAILTLIDGPVALVFIVAASVFFMALLP